MINVELLKRMISNIPNGGAGWMSSYMFYMNTCSHVGLRSVPVTRAVLGSSIEEINAVFGESRGLPSLVPGAYTVNDVVQLINNKGAMAGVGRILNGIEIDNAYKNRLDGYSGHGYSGATGIVDSMHHTAVIQNTYMSHYGAGYVNDIADNTTGSGLAEETPYAPYVISPLDASIIVDPVEFDFSPSLDMSFNIFPEVTSKDDPLTLGSLSKIVESRLRDASSDYNVGYAGAPSELGGTVVGSLRGTTDSPHMIDRRAFVEWPHPWSLRMASTNLEVDDYSKIARLIGTVYESNSQHVYNAQLLKLTMLPASSMNPNGLCLIAMSNVGNWHSPIVAFLSNDRDKVPGVSNAISGPVVAPSCQIFGFATDASSKIATAAAARSPRTVVDVLRIDKPGLAGDATYFVERYHRDLIHTALISHLPNKNPDGSKSTYFELGTFLTKAGSSIETYMDNGDRQFCLQPVCFAMAQQPEDIWLYYVSMDDNLNYWLNRQELGKAHVSEPLKSLAKPPLQMEVVNGELIMMHETKIDIYNISTGAVVSYGASSGIPTGLRALAIDREKSKIYVGHINGIFDFTSHVVVPVDLSSLNADCRIIAPCKLTAVNGYLAWTTASIEDRASIANRTPNWVVRHEVANGVSIAWSCAAITGSSKLSDSIIASSVRSNGDMVVLHSGSYYMNPPTLTWFSVTSSGKMTRRNTKNHFGYWQDTYGSDYRLTGRIFRVDDHHFSVLVLPIRLKQQTLDGTLGLFNITDNGMSQPWTGDFRLDDAGNRIYFYPLPKTESLSSRYVPSQEADRFTTPFNPIPFASVYTRACDYEYAKYSSNIVILDKAYSLFVCGVQLPTSIGIELDWDGSNWIHGTAGKMKVARTTHTDHQNINDWSTAMFISGQYFDSYTAYQIKTYPSTTMSPNQVLMYYFGDLLPGSYSSVIAFESTAIPPYINSRLYCGIEYERSDLITCTVDGTQLSALLGPGSPNENQYSIHKNVLRLHASHVGKQLNITYSYVKAVD